MTLLTSHGSNATHGDGNRGGPSAATGHDRRTEPESPRFGLDAQGNVLCSNIRLDLKTFDKTTIAGKVYTLKPGTFGMDDIPYEYAVTFSAPSAR